MPVDDSSLLKSPGMTPELQQWCQLRHSPSSRFKDIIALRPTSDVQYSLASRWKLVTAKAWKNCSSGYRYVCHVDLQVQTYQRTSSKPWLVGLNDWLIIGIDWQLWLCLPVSEDPTTGCQWEPLWLQLLWCDEQVSMKVLVEILLHFELVLVI